MSRDISAQVAKLAVAFTIEFDNAFEARVPHSTARGPQAHSGRGPWLVSQAMWTNFLRFVGPDGRPTAELAALEPLVNLPGLVRWRYLTQTAGRYVLTAGGRRAARAFAPLAREIDQRWRDRFGPDRVDRLIAALVPITAAAGRELSPALPVSGYRREPIPAWPRGFDAPGDLSVHLSRALQAFRLAFEHSASLSLPLSANVLRVLGDGPVRSAEIGARAGIAREAAAGSVHLLLELELATSEPAAPRGQQIRLTERGVAAVRKYRRLVTAFDDRWPEAKRVLAEFDEPISAWRETLGPPPEGWRANPPYAARTTKLLADPELLPWYPLVSHRGGFPDGS